MDHAKLMSDRLCRDGEDYTDSLCFLLPHALATIIDTDQFAWVSGCKWSVVGRSIFSPELGGMTPIHRHIFARMIAETDSLNVTFRMRKKDVDHVNRNPWDNRVGNLRIATRSQNNMNRAGLPNKSSQYKGVHKVRRSGKWKASAMLRGKLTYLGVFEHEVHAAIAYNRFVARHCPEFAYLNPISASPNDKSIPPYKKPRKKYKRRALSA